VSTPTPGVAPVPYPSAATAPVAPSSSPQAATPASAPTTVSTGPPDVEAIRQTNFDIQAILADLQAGKITTQEAIAAIQARTTGSSAGTTGTPGLTLPTPEELAAAAGATATVDPTVSAGQSIYQTIWGVTPPHGYIESLVKQGLNVFQIQLHELSQPGVQHTQYWRDNEAGIAKQVATLMGRR